MFHCLDSSSSVLSVFINGGPSKHERPSKCTLVRMHLSCVRISPGCTRKLLQPLFTDLARRQQGKKQVAANPNSTENK